MTDVFDVVIVGAGPGGLSTAMLLAGLGLRTALIERKSVPGGRMGRIEEAGYSFDTGPTILQLPQLIEQIFERSGLHISDYIELVPVVPNTRIHFWDGSYLDTFHDHERNRIEWDRFVEDGAARFDRFFDGHAKKYAVAYETFIASDASSKWKYFDPRKLLPTIKYAPWESMHRSLSRGLGDERLIYALSYPSKYLGLHPTTSSSVFSVVPFIELAFGVWHPKGGFRALADAMLKGFTDLGGTVIFDEEVRRIHVDERTQRATSVELASGRTLSAQEVVVNADWGMARERLFGDRKRTVDVAKKRYSCSTFMIYLGLDRVYENVPHHAIYLSEAVRRTDRAALEDRTLDFADPPMYVCNPTVTDPGNAPPGHSAVYVLVPAPNTGFAVDWATEKARFTELILDRLALVGMTDVRGHVRLLRVATAETWRDEFFVHLGAVFNLSHNWLQLGPFRPPSREPGMENVHWVGGGTHPGSGLLTIFESANIAANDIANAYGKKLAKSVVPPAQKAVSASPP